ncbi:hypothetical protein [Luteimonas sp. TWI1416]|uniref:hypothetical protein n=1 Tax=unclassified Luteimonas TaxID=2629088 RepID=UPI00320B91CA
MTPLRARLHAGAIASVLLAVSAGTACQAASDGVQMDTMETKDSLQAAREFVPRVEAFLETLPIGREKFSVRVNRCEGTEGEQRNDLYYIWVGLQGVAHAQDAGRILDDVHARWNAAGWPVTRYRQLPNGGVNVAATDSETGDAYSLDSGFDKGPQSYIVGFFNTPCYRSASGDVQFGEIRQRLDTATAP